MNEIPIAKGTKPADIKIGNLSLHRLYLYYSSIHHAKFPQ